MTTKTNIRLPQKGAVAKITEERKRLRNQPVSPALRDIFKKEKPSSNIPEKKIERVWDTAVDQLGLNFIGLRTDEDHAVLSGQPSWKGATGLVGRFGIGSVDALILDLILNSRFLLLLTSDRDMAILYGGDQATPALCFPSG